MLQGFSDEETADMSFRVEPTDTSEASPTAIGEIFSAHKVVMKTCAKGSILASLCDGCDGKTPVPIKDVAPEIFRLMLRYVYRQPNGRITQKI